MRRKDREMPVDFGLEVLKRCEFAVLSTINEDGTPYSVPISPVLDGEYIYIHGATEGLKMDNIRRNSAVCIACAEDIKRVEKKFTTEYSSAVIKGTAKIVEDAEEKMQVLRLICLKFAPSNMDAFEKLAKASLGRTGIIKIHIDEITAKRKKYDAQGIEMTYGRME